MPFDWTNLHSSKFCIVSAYKRVTRYDIEQFLTASVQDGFQDYAKLIDMTTGALSLDAEDGWAVAASLTRYFRSGPSGPIAIVVADAVNLDMAVLLKQRIGNRPFRIFTNATAARSWLEDQEDVRPLAAMVLPASVIFRPGQRPPGLTPEAHHCEGGLFRDAAGPGPRM
jgi:hypothetical protein